MPLEATSSILSEGSNHRKKGKEKKRKEKKRKEKKRKEKKRKEKKRKEKTTPFGVNSIAITPHLNLCCHGYSLRKYSFCEALHGVGVVYVHICR